MLARKCLMMMRARAHLKEEGWCAIPNVLSKQETGNALARLWAAAEESKKRGDDTFLPFLDPNESNVRVFLSARVGCYLLRDDRAPNSSGMVKSVLGENYLISSFTANIARPGSKSMGLHSDQSLVSPDPWLTINALNMIWCLTDCYFENGATLYIPGSKKWERRSDIPKNAKQMLKPFEAKAGSIIVMDGRVWHTSGQNVTKDRDRALLFDYYTAPFLRQQDNWTKKLSKEVQDSMSPEFQERLGLGITVNLGEAILHLKYLDDQFEETASNGPTTAEIYAQSSHNQ